MPIRPIVHILLHFVVPAAVARAAWPRRFFKAFGILVATMLVDLDHLLADPLYDPNRCSIGTHPLHTAPAIVLYAGLLAFKPTRIVAVGLLIHMALDGIDCAWMTWS